MKQKRLKYALSVCRSRILSVLLVACCLPSLQGSRMQVPVPEYFCLNPSACPLQFPSDSTALSNFHSKLNRLLFEGQGRIRILHIGGSHVQAGVLSDRLRSRFVNLSPALSSGRGLIFPYRVAQTNNPANYEVHYTGHWTATRNVSRRYDVRLGLSGIAVTTDDPSASLTVFLNRSAAYRTDFNRLTLLAYDTCRAYEPRVAAFRETESLPQGREEQWLRGVYDEDSRTWRFSLDDYADAFMLSFQPADTALCDGMHFTLRGILAENDSQGIEYDAVGVNGASVRDYLRCEDFGQDLQLIRPDLVIFGIGINDATQADFTKELFVSRYDSLICRIRAVAPDCSYIFVTNNDSYLRRIRPNPQGETARVAFFDMAAGYGAALWDVFSLMGGLGSASRWEMAGLMKPDLVHFTNPGYELLGDLLFNAIMEDYFRFLQP